MMSRNNEKAFRAELHKRLDGIAKQFPKHKFSDFKKTISEKYALSLSEISSFAKDFYIGFAGKKSLDDCIALAYELEEKSRKTVLDIIRKDSDDHFPLELIKHIQSEFFNGAECISLKDASDFFFKNTASKEVQGKRIRRQNDMFDRLLHCAFAFILDDAEFNDERCYRFEYQNIYYNQNSSDVHYTKRANNWNGPFIDCKFENS